MMMERREDEGNYLVKFSCCAFLKPFQGQNETNMMKLMFAADFPKSDSEISRFVCIQNVLIW